MIFEGEKKEFAQIGLDGYFSESRKVGLNLLSVSDLET